ncbi:transporter substrate-binding domain-containing protein [Acetobacterium wieringae]|uniref:HD domain-containing phosphohydrolase n=1 Tax=Acetobacterium wieringae TaxID=52694 RepID=UPI0026EB600A|nr:transporter substrate-binding domain-containing protein [Acetobacterium wieringae]
MKTNKKVFMMILFVLLCLPIVTVFSQGKSVSEKPVLIIGDDINYPPYSFRDANGNATGFNIDLARAVAAAMGYDVEFRLDEWDKTRAALEAGEIDAIAGMFYSDERKETYAFTAKHSVTNGDIFTRKDIVIETVDALRDQTVVVQRGDIVAEYLSQLDLNINLVEVATVNEALRLVAEGYYDYAGVLKLPGLYNIKQMDLKNLRAQNLVLTPNDYCMAVAKDNETLLITLNSGLQIIKATGEYDQIYERWLGVYEKQTVFTLIEEYRWPITIVLAIILILGAMNLLLNRMVTIRTRSLNEMNARLQANQEQLEAANLQLEDKMSELISMESSIREQYDLLQASQAQLQRSEEKNRSIVQALPDIVFTINDDGRYLECQASDEKLQADLVSRYLGKSLKEVFPQDIAAEALAKISTAIATKQLQTFEYERFIDGQREIFEMRLVRNNQHEVIGITRNITAAKLSLERIEYLSYHDQLTGLHNRHYFEVELRRLDHPWNLPLCLMMADVNGLKLVNDTFGHAFGDQLLNRVAKVLQKACGLQGIIARIGGDEFIILVPNCTVNETLLLVERIQKLSAREKIGSIQLSISLGWGIKSTIDQDVQEVLKLAETKMYKQKLFEGPSIRGNTIQAIISTLNEKNKREEQHSDRVSTLCRQFAQALHFSEQETKEIESVGLLHDIGKIAIDEAILNKPGKLTDAEYEEMKRHPEIGYRILNTVNDMAEIADVVLNHHERWDGKGYPRGLIGDRIPLQSRMIAIADAYDAITSDRSYRNKRTDQQACDELRKNAGSQFDPWLVEVFIEVVCPAASGRE